MSDPVYTAQEWGPRNLRGVDTLVQSPITLWCWEILSAFLFSVFMLQILLHKLHFLSISVMELPWGRWECRLWHQPTPDVCYGMVRWAAVYGHFPFVQWHRLSGLWKMGASSSPAVGAGPEEAQCGWARLHQSSGQSYSKWRPAPMPGWLTGCLEQVLVMFLKTSLLLV